MTRQGLVVVLAVGAALALLLLWSAGDFLSRPAARVVGAAPPELQARNLTLPTDQGGSVAGWYTHGTPGAGAVLLLHGVRGDRRDMLGRARFLHAAGYAVLLIDLPAHGESSGAAISFGLREAAGVRAALAWLRRQLPGERVGVIGVSLGAAALVLSHSAPPPAAVVLESMYPTIGEAVRNRLAMRVGPLGGAMAPLLLWQLPLRLGVAPEHLQPLDYVAALGAPLLLISGSADEHTAAAETRRLFAAAREPKALWLVDSAAHVNLHAHDPGAYEARVLAFLAAHLRP